eukprot:gene15272-6801_t
MSVFGTASLRGNRVVGSGDHGGGGGHLQDVREAAVTGGEWSGNDASGPGGGLYFSRRDPVASALSVAATLRGNRARFGGGACGANTKEVAVVGGKWYGNVGTEGGAMWFGRNKHYTAGQVFPMAASVSGAAAVRGNHAGSGGGVVFLNAHKAVLCGGVFADNDATLQGGGAMYVQDDAALPAGGSMSGKLSMRGNRATMGAGTVIRGIRAAAAAGGEWNDNTAASSADGTGGGGGALFGTDGQASQPMAVSISGTACARGNRASNGAGAWLAAAEVVRDTDAKLKPDFARAKFSTVPDTDAKLKPNLWADNAASVAGGAHQIIAQRVALSAAVVRGSRAPLGAGSAFVNSREVIITGGDWSGNLATSRGGAVGLAIYPEEGRTVWV